VRYLWLTLCDPEPQINGQFIYSGGLIRAVANAGAELTVLGLSRQSGPGHHRQDPNIDWHFAKDRRPGRWCRVMSRFPSLALRTRVPDMQAALMTHLANGPWDAVLMDSFNVAWALPHLLRYRRRNPRTKIAYLAENQEAVAARAVALAERGWRRVVRLADSIKTEWFERKLVRAVDLVTADSPDDCAELSALSPAKPVLFMPPGYDGPRISMRTIDDRLPRRAIVVGSFDWSAKRASLESFLSVAAPLLASNGITLQVVGRTEHSYVSSLRRRFPSVEVVGTVPDVQPYLEKARIALVPDLLGGFKLKSLSYIFNRVPIFAIEGAVPGTPLSDGCGLRLFKTHAELARGVVDSIDHTASLNEQQETAYSLSADRFDWNVIAQNLILELQEAPVLDPSAAFESSDSSIATLHERPVVVPL
jgi:glycosyltransferase involved in cell wall biosynthesis